MAVMFMGGEYSTEGVPHRNTPVFRTTALENTRYDGNFYQIRLYKDQSYTETDSVVVSECILDTSTSHTQNILSHVCQLLTQSIQFREDIDELYEKMKRDEHTLEKQAFVYPFEFDRFGPLVAIRTRTFPSTDTIDFPVMIMFARAYWNLRKSIR